RDGYRFAGRPDGLRDLEVRDGRGDEDAARGRHAPTIGGLEQERSDAPFDAVEEQRLDLVLGLVVPRAAEREHRLRKPRLREEQLAHAECRKRSDLDRIHRDGRLEVHGLAAERSLAEDVARPAVAERDDAPLLERALDADASAPEDAKAIDGRALFDEP